MTDQIGTVRQIYNADTVTPNRQDRDAWGKATTPNPAIGNMGFAGEYTDRDLGLVFLRARWGQSHERHVSHPRPVRRTRRAALLPAPVSVLATAIRFKLNHRDLP